MSLYNNHIFMGVHRQRAFFRLARVVHELGKPFFLFVLAAWWGLEIHLHVAGLRFDVAAVLHQPLAQVGQIEHFVDQCSRVVFVELVEQRVFGPVHDIFGQKFRALVDHLLCDKEKTKLTKLIKNVQKILTYSHTPTQKCKKLQKEMWKVSAK